MLFVRRTVVVLTLMMGLAHFCASAQNYRVVYATRAMLDSTDIDAIRYHRIVGPNRERFERPIRERIRLLKRAIDSIGTVLSCPMTPGLSDVLVSIIVRSGRSMRVNLVDPLREAYGMSKLCEQDYQMLNSAVRLAMGLNSVEKQLAPQLYVATTTIDSVVYVLRGAYVYHPPDSERAYSDPIVVFRNELDSAWLASFGADSALAAYLPVFAERKWMWWKTGDPGFEFCPCDFIRLQHAREILPDRP